MVLTVIQDRPVYKYNNDYYFVNYSDIIKYGKLCDKLIYCCSVEVTYDKSVISKYKCWRDFHFLEIKEVIKSPLKEFLHTSSFNKIAVKDVVSRADIVVIKLPSITIGRWAYRYLKRIGKKCILESIACGWDSYWYHNLKGKIMAVPSYLNMRSMIYNADYVVYVTNKFLQVRYPTKGEWIAASNVVLEEADEAILQKRLKKIDETKVNDSLKIGTAGAVNIKFKGQEYVIRAIARLKAEGIHFDYYMAGGGDQTRLAKLASKLGIETSVHFLGAVPKNKMTEFYDSLDIYIHPSLAEGLPRVLIEAERRALPSCGAKAAGTPELLEDDFVFAKQDVESVCKVLKKFSKDVMRKQAQINFKRSKEYSLPILDERRKNFYREVLNN